MPGELKRLNDEARHTDPSKPQHTMDLRTALDLLDRAAGIITQTYFEDDGAYEVLGCCHREVQFGHGASCRVGKWLADYRAARGE